MELDKNKELLEGCYALEGWEGFKATVYLDSENIETIGIGRNLEIFPMKEGELEEDGTWSHVAAVAWAYNRLSQCRKSVVVGAPWVTEQPPIVRIILTDMAYNIGVTGLWGFRNMLANLKACNYTKAAMELQDSKYFKQTGRRALSHYRSLMSLEAEYKEVKD